MAAGCLENSEGICYEEWIRVGGSSDNDNGLGCTGSGRNNSGGFEVYHHQDNSDLVHNYHFYNQYGSPNRCCTPPLGKVYFGPERQPQ